MHHQSVCVYVWVSEFRVQFNVDWNVAFKIHYQIKYFLFVFSFSPYYVLILHIFFSSSGPRKRIEKDFNFQCNSKLNIERESDEEL